MKKTKKKLVSVVVPVYNSEKYLPRCIKSIMDQSYEDIEVILVDDGSTDTSGKICDRYARIDKRIKSIHKKNSGPATARNQGIENSKGDFIFFVDSDDFIETNSISLLMSSYNKYKADMIIGDFKKIKNGLAENRKDISFNSSRLLNKQEIVNYSQLYLKKPNRYLLFSFVWGRLFKSSIIKENNLLFDKELHTFEDLMFNFNYLNHTNNVYFLKEVVYNYLIYGDYSSSTMTIDDNPKKLLGYKLALVSIGNFLRRKVSDYKINKEIGHAYIFLTIIQLVRICGQINKANNKKIYKLVKEIVNDLNLRKSLNFYSPSKNESKILPILMKLRLILPIIWVCKYKSNKRYKKTGK